MITSVMFSLKDSVILIAIFLGLLFSLFFYRQKKGSRHTNIMLANFLLIQSVAMLTSVIAFLEQFSDPQGLPNSDIFYSLSLFSYLEALFLFFYTRSLYMPERGIRSSDGVYLIPVLCAIVYTYFYYYSWDLEARQLTRRFALCSYLFLVHIFLTLGKIAFGFACLKNIKEYKYKLMQCYSNPGKVDVSWFYWLVISYIITRVLGLITPSYIVYAVTFLGSDGLVPGSNLNIVNFATDLIWLFTLSALIYFGMHYSPKFQGLSDSNSEHIREIKDVHIKRLDEYMCQYKPYTEPSLTIDELSVKLSIPVKLLSAIINLKHGKNFCEFINDYRIESAKMILISPQHKDKNIAHVMECAGFNSKATFNRVFKQATGYTPLQYRKQSGGSNGNTSALLDIKGKA